MYFFYCENLSTCLFYILIIINVVHIVHNMVCWWLSAGLEEQRHTWYMKEVDLQDVLHKLLLDQKINIKVKV